MDYKPKRNTYSGSYGQPAATYSPDTKKINIDAFEKNDDFTAPMTPPDTDGAAKPIVQKENPSKHTLTKAPQTSEDEFISDEIIGGADGPTTIVLDKPSGGFLATNDTASDPLPDPTKSGFVKIDEKGREIYRARVTHIDLISGNTMNSFGRIVYQFFNKDNALIEQSKTCIYGVEIYQDAIILVAYNPAKNKSWIYKDLPQKEIKTARIGSVFLLVLVFGLLIGAFISGIRFNNLVAMAICIGLFAATIIISFIVTNAHRKLRQSAVEKSDDSVKDTATVLTVASIQVTTVLNKTTTTYSITCKRCEDETIYKGSAKNYCPAVGSDVRILYIPGKNICTFPDASLKTTEFDILDQADYQDADAEFDANEGDES